MGDDKKKVALTPELQTLIEDTVKATFDAVELGGIATPYQASFAGKSNSALSFGRAQHDIGSPPNDQTVTNFKNILQHGGGFTEKKIEQIAEVGKQKQLSENQFIKGIGGQEVFNSVNAALNSDYGRETIDAMDKDLIGLRTQDIVKVFEAAAQNPNGPGVFDINNPDLHAVALAIAWINSSGEPSKILDYLRGESVTLEGKTYQLNGAATVEGFIIYLGGTKEFTKDSTRLPKVVDKCGRAAGVVTLQSELRQAEEDYYSENRPGSAQQALGKKVITLKEKLDNLTNHAKPYTPDKGQKNTVNPGTNYVSSSGDRFYPVKPGDTLAKIAAINKTSVNRLAERNGIKDINKLSVGQIIIIPPREVMKTASSQENINVIRRKINSNESISAIKGQVKQIFEKAKPLAPLLGPVPLATLPKLPKIQSPTPKYIIHKVQPGETLNKIATLYKSKPGVIQQHNASKIIDPNKIKAGDKFYIPQPATYKADPSPFSVQVATKSQIKTKSSNQMPDWEMGVAIDRGKWKVTFDPKILNSDGLTSVAPSSIITDSYRPGGQEISSFNYSDIYKTPRIQGNIEFNKNGTLNFTITTSRANNFQAQANKILNIDPLILDMDGDGVQLVDYHHSNILFDVDKDGEKEITGWATGGDGFLVHDRNQDGQINDISEMISEYYVDEATDGFEALATLDEDKDEVFDAKDPAFDVLRVWVDANQNGQAEAEELKKLSEHNIKSISLNAKKTNGRVLMGNEVVAKGTMVKDGKNHEVLSVQFLSDEAGHSIQSSSSGHLVTSQAQIKSFLAQGTGGSVLNLAEGFVINEDGEKKELPKDINSVYGSEGDDTLIGDDKDNWLAGNEGSDIIRGGGGNDVLIVDAEDFEENIDGGEGFDILHVVGDRGVNLNLARIGVEVAHGGRGDDWFEGGGKSTVYIRGGQGDDTIFGSIAGDALAGEEDNDYIDGNDGNDLIRGHLGNDILLGGIGNDVLDGGQGDDYIEGGIGDDVLIPGGGTNILIGDKGCDLVQLSGDYNEYNIEKKGNYYIVADTVAERDGISYVYDCEKLQFKNDIIDFNAECPLPVKDIITVEDTPSRTYKIPVAQLTKNDIDYQKDKLSVHWVGQAKGGSVTLSKGEVVFKADPNYQGALSFRYQIKDHKGNTTLVSSDSNPQRTVPMMAEVFLKRPHEPNDPLYFEQWYLSAINVQSAWKDYSGKGIEITINETNFVDYSHPDLIDNLSKEALVSKVGKEDRPSHDHPTMVAGIAAASRNDKGIVGIAYNAKLSSWSIFSSGNEGNPDVINCSFGFKEAFYPSTAVKDQVEYNAINGRNGLGIPTIFAAGNERQKGLNANYDSTSNNWYAIVVAALNPADDLSVLRPAKTPFSQPGANILVTAPGSNVSSTNMALFNSLGSRFSTSYEENSGTSTAAPITSGVVALMFEANPMLGYRDVQHILAASARQITDSKTKWVTNGATYWNGGGMHFSHDYGAGLEDAHPAVRLSETWLETKTYHNAAIYHSPEHEINLAIPDGKTVKTSLMLLDEVIREDLVIGDSILVEHVEVLLDIEHQQLGDLVVSLVSPAGTESILINRPGKVPGSAKTDQGMGKKELRYVFESTHHLGEIAPGTWTLKVQDAMGNKRTGVLKSWAISVLGSPISKSEKMTKTLVYTNEYASLGKDAKRRLIHEPNESIALNASPMTSDVKIDLNLRLGKIAGHKVTISKQTDIYALIGGDGNDELIGGASDVILYGGRGNDVLKGGQGSDLLVAGPGINILEGRQESDYFIIGNHLGAQHTIKDFSATDNIVFYGFGVDFKKEHLHYSQQGKNAEILYLGQKIILENFNTQDLSDTQFTFLPQQNTNLNNLIKNVRKTGLDRGKLDAIYEDVLYVDGGLSPTSGGPGNDYFVVRHFDKEHGMTIKENQIIAPGIITDFDPLGCREKIDLTAFKHISSMKDLRLQKWGINNFTFLQVVIPLGADEEQALFLQNVTPDQMKPDHFVFYKKETPPVVHQIVQQVQPLVANTDFFVVKADTSLKIPVADLLKNDKGKDPSKLAVTAVQENGYCDVALEKDGQVTLIPNKGFKGWARFQYTVENALEAKAVGDVAIFVKETLPFLSMSKH